MPLYNGAAGQAQAERPVSAREGSLRHGGGCVLNIEDNQINREVLGQIVRLRSDLTFLEAPDGLSGLALARERLPRLVIIDMQLPDIDGLAVLEALRADPATAGLRCIALSADAMPAEVQRAREAGFDDYWTKPLDLATVEGELLLQFGRPQQRLKQDTLT